MLLALLLPQLLINGSFVTAQIANSPQLRLELVCTPKSIQQGLSNRDSIGSDGMLFVYKKASHYKFWMKQMRFNIDMLWIYNDRVIEICPNVAAPKTEHAPLLLYGPDKPADMVLELNAGDAERWDIHIGSKINFN